VGRPPNSGASELAAGMSCNTSDAGTCDSTLSSNGDKGAFHRALRLAFPVAPGRILVTGDPQSTCSPLSSSKKGQAIQVGVEEHSLVCDSYL
jgi:hypothetical protein